MILIVVSFYKHPVFGAGKLQEVSTGGAEGEAGSPPGGEGTGGCS